MYRFLEAVTTYSNNSILQKEVNSTFFEVIVKSHPANSWVKAQEGRLVKIDLPELKIACNPSTTMFDLKKEILNESLRVLSPVSRPLSIEENIRVIACGKSILNEELIFAIGAPDSTSFWYVIR